MFETVQPMPEGRLLTATLAVPSIGIQGASLSTVSDPATLTFVESIWSFTHL